MIINDWATYHVVVVDFPRVDVDFYVWRYGVAAMTPLCVMLWADKIVIDDWLWVVHCLKFVVSLPIWSSSGFFFSSSITCFVVCLEARLLHLHVSLRVYKHVYYISRLLVFSSIIPCFVACLQTRLLLHHVLLRVYTIFTASRGFFFPLWYSNSGSTVGVAFKVLGILIVANYLRRSITLNFEHTCASELEHDHYWNQFMR